MQFPHTWISLSRDSGNMLAKFLLATERGFAWAARKHSADVTTLFLEQVDTEHPDLPEGTVPKELVRESVQYMKGFFLQDDGHWGRMDSAVWEGFLSWLQKEGLLTTYIQSRNPVPGTSVTLDELRQGNVGSPLPHDRFELDKIYTNQFLELGR